ncbi:MAG: hypothetical protein QGG64_16255 [Candidatus Latescibacteria bacterium]|nr:hypothetical protein [Candidatus Latescibacterota bacterium]
MEDIVTSGDWRFAIPMPLQIVIDDVGWWSGVNDSESGGPFRSGIVRDHVPADYEAIVVLGQKLGMRPQAAFIACEWDRENILKDIPTSTWMGADWDNNRWVGPWLEEAADILRTNRDHVELVAHGVGHEYWESGEFTRSEFHFKGGTIRPRDEVLRHLEAFGRILEQNGLESFPESFVPPAFNHSFGNGEDGIQAILRDFGVKYISTLFQTAKQFAPPQDKRLMVECGVMVIERGHVGIPWYEVASEPPWITGQPIYGIHWPNILHADPSRNLEVVDRWVKVLRPYGHLLDGLLASDTAVCWTQFAYQALAEMVPVENGVEIDLSSVKTLPSAPIRETFTVKVDAPEAVRWVVNGGILISDDFDRENGYHVLCLKAEGGRLLLEGTE